MSVVLRKLLAWGRQSYIFGSLHGFLLSPNLTKSMISGPQPETASQGLKNMTQKRPEGSNHNIHNMFEDGVGPWMLPTKSLCTLCCAMVHPARKAGFRAGFRPDSIQETF